MIADAVSERTRDVRGLAWHDRAHIAHRRGRVTEAIDYAYEAWSAIDDPVARERVLGDLAAIALAAGYRETARDANMVLLATAREPLGAVDRDHQLDGDRHAGSSRGRLHAVAPKPRWSCAGAGHPGRISVLRRPRRPRISAPSSGNRGITARSRDRRATASSVRCSSARRPRSGERATIHTIRDRNRPSPRPSAWRTSVQRCRTHGHWRRSRTDRTITQRAPIRSSRLAPAALLQAYRVSSVCPSPR